MHVVIRRHTNLLSTPLILLQKPLPNQFHNVKNSHDTLFSFNMSGCGQTDDEKDAAKFVDRIGEAATKATCEALQSLNEVKESTRKNSKSQHDQLTYSRKS